MYCRATFHGQFKFLQKRVIDHGACGWILGPSGTGKGVTTLAFISALNYCEWVISWIHLGDLEVRLTMFDGQNARSTTVSRNKLADSALDEYLFNNDQQSS